MSELSAYSENLPDAHTGPESTSARGGFGHSLRSARVAIVITAVVGIPPALVKWGGMPAWAVLGLLALAAAGSFLHSAGRAAWSRTWAFAKVTFLENHRYHLMYGAFLLSWAPGLMAYFASDADGTRVGRALLVQHWFGVGITAIGCLLGVLTASLALSGDFDSKRVYTVMTKPVPRWTVVAGKWLGLQLYLGLFVLSGYIATLLFTALVAREPVPTTTDGKPLYYLDTDLGRSVFSARDDIPLIFCGINPSCRTAVPVGKRVSFPLFVQGVFERNTKIVLMLVGPPDKVSALTATVLLPVPAAKEKPTDGEAAIAEEKRSPGYLSGQGVFDEKGRAAVIIDVDPDIDWSRTRNKYARIELNIRNPKTPDRRFTVPWLTASVFHAVGVSSKAIRQWEDGTARHGRDAGGIIKFLTTRQAAVNHLAAWLVPPDIAHGFRHDAGCTFRSRMVAMRGMISSYYVNYTLRTVSDLPGARGEFPQKFKAPRPDGTVAVKSREEYLLLAGKTGEAENDVDGGDAQNSPDEPLMLLVWPNDPFESLGFRPIEGVAAAPRVRSWPLNLFLMYLIIWLETGTLTAIVLLWGGAVSFPVAVTLGLVMSLGGQITGVAVKMVGEQMATRRKRNERRLQLVEQRKENVRKAQLREPKLRQKIKERIAELKKIPGMTVDKALKDAKMLKLRKEYGALAGLLASFPDPDKPGVLDRAFLTKRENSFWEPFPPAQQRYYDFLKAVCSVPPDLRRFDARSDLKLYRYVPFERVAAAFISMFWLQAGILGGVGMLLFYRREIAGT